MAPFVLVHGGGHAGWCYQLVARLLRTKGHMVYAPSLPGMGEHTHMLHTGIDLDAHIDDVVGLLFSEDLRDAILVGHSYGGMVITGVADRASERTGHRVCLDAAYPSDGELLHEHAFAAIDQTRQAMYVVDGVELVMKPEPWKCFSQKLVLRNEAAMRAIPESHLICTSTAATRDMA